MLLSETLPIVPIVADFVLEYIVPLISESVILKLAADPFLILSDHIRLLLCVRQ